MAFVLRRREEGKANLEKYSQSKLITEQVVLVQDKRVGFFAFPISFFAVENFYYCFYKTTKTKRKLNKLPFDGLTAFEIISKFTKA